MKVQTLKSLCISIKRKVEDWQHEFCIWFLIITSKMRSVLNSAVTGTASGGGFMLAESPLEVGRSW